jgi:hypothetical protein
VFVPRDYGRAEPAMNADLGGTSDGSFVRFAAAPLTSVAGDLGQLGRSPAASQVRTGIIHVLSSA